ncbi:hypothetical protein MPH_13219 [Macrophomina phaseolina MS6]|uniref:Uncharacterized protein n=1 Tax=Macrophomina phaseolina (strain MS6) TaxID=1126212 RepID=K2RA13_MACPH|nr:hypothetical protein MPH_13219 [Macrophomina phaseolina MS6]
MIEALNNIGVDCACLGVCYSCSPRFPEGSSLMHPRTTSSTSAYHISRIYPRGAPFHGFAPMCSTRPWVKTFPSATVRRRLWSTAMEPESASSGLWKRSGWPRSTCCHRTSSTNPRRQPRRSSSPRSGVRAPNSSSRSRTSASPTTSSWPRNLPA